MNRTRLFGIGIVLMFAVSVLAQQNAPVQANPQHHGMPSVDDHLKMLTEKLSLTSDQQTKIRPVLQQMNDSMQKVMQDQSLSQDERRAKHQELFETADSKVRKFLNDDQKKKLDDMEQEQHMR